MKHWTKLISLLLTFCGLVALAQETPKPISPSLRETLAKEIIKTQAAQLNFFRTREQAQAAINRAEEEARAAQAKLDEAIRNARSADKVGAECNPSIEFEWSCPAQDAKSQPTPAAKD